MTAAERARQVVEQFVLGPFGSGSAIGLLGSRHASLVSLIQEALLAHEAAVREECGQLLIDADSFLSLLYHRHLDHVTVDTRLDLDVREVLGRLRKASDAVIAARSTGGTEER